MSHENRIEIPNSVDDLGLPANPLRIYIHIKRVAGDNGKCWKSQDSIASQCKLSTKTVIDAKRKLEKYGLISIDKQSWNGRKRDVISVVDIWGKDLSEAKKLIAADTENKSKNKSHRSKAATDTEDRSKAATDTEDRSKAATDTEVDKTPLAVQNRHCKKNQVSITNKEEPSIPAKIRGPRLSKNPLIARMQKALGFLEKVKTDPIPNPAKEAAFIKKMLDRGFTEEQIFRTWQEKVNKKHGQFVSMYYVNEDIGGNSSGTNRQFGFEKHYTPPPGDNDELDLGLKKHYDPPPD